MLDSKGSAEMVVGGRPGPGLRLYPMVELTMCSIRLMGSVPEWAMVIHSMMLFTGGAIIPVAAFFLFVDGSARLLTYDTNHLILLAMSSRNGEEPKSNPD